MNLEGSLIFPMCGDSVLLGRKMRGIGAGFWNGFGGKAESGETIEEGALRELEEEIGIVGAPADLVSAGVIDFHNTRDGEDEIGFRVHIFILKHWGGEPQESEEMKSLTWFPLADLPLHEMRPADCEWMPAVFEGNIIQADVTYAPDKTTLVGGVKMDVVGRWK